MGHDGAVKSLHMHKCKEEKKKMKTSGLVIEQPGCSDRDIKELVKCEECKYYEEPWCTYVAQDEEGVLCGGCPYGKKLGSLEDLFGGVQ